MNGYLRNQNAYRRHKFIKNTVGWISAFLIISAYALLSFDVITHKDMLYNGINLLGGVGLAWRVLQDRNYSNFILEIIFILIALKSLFL